VADDDPEQQVDRGLAAVLRIAVLRITAVALVVTILMWILT
jgi:hypothetical protein